MRVGAVAVLFGCLFRTLAADVSYFGVVKSIRYEQTNGSAPALLSTNAFGFSAFVVAATNNVVTNATVKPANTTPLRTLLPDTNGLTLMYNEVFSTQAALDSAYPVNSGFSVVNYTTTMYTVHEGVQSASLSFYLLPPILQVSYPSIPQLSDLAAAQSIDSTRDFELTWNSLGGSTITIVQLSIMDAASNVVFATPAPFQPGALSGNSTSAIIPAYSLPPGSNWIGHLTVANPGAPNTNSYAGATGVAALARDTQFAVATRPAPAPPRLVPVPQASTAFQLQLQGETNRFYQIEASTNLRNWTNLFTTNSATGIFEYRDWDSTNFSLRFYRGKVGQ